MTSAVKRTFDRRGARAKAQSSPPCSFIRLITPRIAEQFHHLKLTLKLSRQWGALHCLAIFNTAGILPILYLWLFQKKAAPETPRT